jgi:hypothetical protein
MRPRLYTIALFSQCTTKDGDKAIVGAVVARTYQRSRNGGSGLHNLQQSTNLQQRALWINHI